MVVAEERGRNETASYRDLPRRAQPRSAGGAIRVRASVGDVIDSDPCVMENIADLITCRRNRVCNEGPK